MFFPEPLVAALKNSGYGRGTPGGGRPAGTVDIAARPRTVPLNRHLEMLYAGLEEQGWSTVHGDWQTLLFRNYRVVHYHWPEHWLNRRSWLGRLAGLIRILGELSVVKLRGAKVVWTVHNLKGHEERTGWMGAIYRAVFFRCLDGFISLSESGHRLLLASHRQFGRLPGAVIPRGDYRPIYPNPPGREAARKRTGFGPDDTVIGLIGMIRPYKNAARLIELFRSAGDANLRLVVAGECGDTGLRKKLEELASSDSRVRLRLEAIPDAEIPVWMRSLDLMVLPYRDILNSGSALLALSLDVPVLAPALGAMTELRDNVGGDWVTLYEGEVTTPTLVDGIARSRSPRAERAPLDHYSWKRNALQTTEFLQQLLEEDQALRRSSSLPV